MQPLRGGHDMKANSPGATKYTAAIIRRALDAKAQGIKLSEFARAMGLSRHGLMDAIRKAKI
jgi:hypothetical protein